jgi:hypothetical protein
LGFGNCIPTQSVPGIGATIRTDLDLSDNEISFDNHSIVASLIPSSGFILIWTIEGPISNHSIIIGTLNSINLFCNAFAFSIRNVSSIVIDCSALVSRIAWLNVGFSPEKFIVGLVFLSLTFSFSSIFLSSLSLMSDLMSERETGLQNSGFISSSSSSSYLETLGFELWAFGLFSLLRLMVGKEKFSEYKIHTTARISKIIINDFVAIALPPNMTCNNVITGQEMYHQSFSYLSTSPSMMGKFITPEIIMIMTINCLMISFIRYHFAIMIIPTKKHNAKKTYNPISPNAMLA